LKATRKNVGFQEILETDRFTVDAFDAVLIQASSGNDEIVVDTQLTIAGTINGGLGNDTTVAPTKWVKQNCEA
jgi:hypothetical protein